MAGKLKSTTLAPTFRFCLFSSYTCNYVKWPKQMPRSTKRLSLHRSNLQVIFRPNLLTCFTWRNEFPAPYVPLHLSVQWLLENSLTYLIQDSIFNGLAFWPPFWNTLKTLLRNTCLLKIDRKKRSLKTVAVLFRTNIPSDTPHDDATWFKRLDVNQQTLEQKKLMNYYRLEKIDLSNNIIEEISIEAFQGQDGLKTLGLSKNQLR